MTIPYRKKRHHHPIKGEFDFHEHEFFTHISISKNESNHNREEME